MECFDNSTAFSELSINRAPELRCNGSKFTICGHCEGCEIGNQLSHTKQWFLRCAEQVKRQFVLGLVHRFNSPDLHDYINALLSTLEGKDFTYARSRNRPSLKDDMATSSSNHALDRWQIHKDMYACLNWFESRRYWTKCNFMLGLMQVCNAQLLQIIGSESRSLCLLNEEPDNYGIGETEVKGDQHESSPPRVTFGAVYSPSSPSPSKDNVPFMTDDFQQLSIGQNTRSAVSTISHKTSQHLKLTLGVCQTGETWNSKLQMASQSTPRTSNSANRLKKQSQLHFEASSTEDLRTLNDEELSEDLDDDYISVEPSSVTDLLLPTSCVLVQHHKDFIRCLPVHLSKLILSYLDKASLINCLCISKHWRVLSEDVQQDALVHQTMVEEVMMMQGATAKGLNPKYAKKLFVCVPKYEDEIHLDKNFGKNSLFTDATNRLHSRTDEIQFRSMAYCYEGVETVKVEMEERNLYCGAYNVFVLQDSEDPNRCTTYNGGQLVACGSSDRRVRLLDASTGRSERIIKGHAGSVKCLYISEKRGFVLSGSYDTSIRCWDIKEGKCRCIFRGHRATVLCLALSGNNLASGSRDKSVKVWNFETGRCRRTFRHHHVVLCVEVSDSIVVSGCEGCKVKVWEIESATLVKTLEGHQSPVSGITFNKYHIISSSKDCYALAWSAIGKHKKCLQAFRHPKEVLCVKIMYCRVITGAADGKLRVWNLLNGDCLRIIRGNSKNDVITSLYIADNRILINTLSNLLILNFEVISWKYNLPPDRPESLGSLNNYSKCPPRRRPRSYVRAQKQARGAQIDNLISRPAISCPSFCGYLDRSISMTPFSIQASSTRISSAPVNVTRQVFHSIDHHVQRLSLARDRKPRPYSSPTNIMERKNNQDLTSSNQSCFQETNTDLNVTVKEVRNSVKPSSLASRSNILSRGKSAPPYRTAEVSGNKRDWTSSAKDVVTTPHNKLMPTAAQSREFFKKRPKSAHFAAKRNETSIDHLKNVSCLNLRTYTAQVDQPGLLKTENEKHGKCHKKTRAGEKQKIPRPASCIT